MHIINLNMQSDNKWEGNYLNVSPTTFTDKFANEECGIDTHFSPAAFIYKVHNSNNSQLAMENKIAITDRPEYHNSKNYYSCFFQVPFVTGMIYFHE